MVNIIKIKVNSGDETCDLCRQTALFFLSVRPGFLAVELNFRYCRSCVNELFSLAQTHKDHVQKNFFED